MIRTSFRISALALAVALGGSVAWAQSAAPSVPEAARAHPALWPQAASPAAMTDARTEAFVAGLMARMTLEEKVGQLIQADISTITPEDMLTYPLGSILAGGSSGPWGDDTAPPERWLALAHAFREANARRGGTVIPL
ncbi:MAG TPA: 1,4-beta-D-glucan glucohydrolase, partial [Brevundimonas sp.]